VNPADLTPSERALLLTAQINNGRLAADLTPDWQATADTLVERRLLAIVDGRYQLTAAAGPVVAGLIEQMQERTQ
jgi:hypothetical protein